MPIQIAALGKALKGENLVEAFKAQQSIRQKIDDLVTSSLEHKGHSIADKIVIFIDELDRCRPEFAMHLLEQIKTLFQNDRIIIVYSADLEELSYAVNGFYGPSFRAQKYLSRFFDSGYRLTHVDGFEFSHNRHHLDEQNLYVRLIAELQNNEHETIREASRVDRLIADGEHYANGHFGGGIAEQTANCVILPLLIFIYQSDLPLYRRITGGQDFDALYEYGKQFSVVHYTIQKALSTNPQSDDEDSRKKITDREKEYMHDLCVLVFSQDRNSQPFHKAAEKCRWYPDRVALRTFRQLDFPRNDLMSFEG